MTNLAKASRRIADMKMRGMISGIPVLFRRNMRPNVLKFIICPIKCADIMPNSLPMPRYWTKEQIKDFQHLYGGKDSHFPIVAFVRNKQSAAIFSLTFPDLICFDTEAVLLEELEK